MMKKIAAVCTWRAAGNKFGIISGRGGKNIKIIAEQHPQLELDFLAACNGGHIYDGNGRVIYEARCTTLSLRTLVKDLLLWGSMFAYVIAKESFYTITDWEKRPSNVPAEEICLFEELREAEYFNQVSVQLPTVEETLKVVAHIENSYGQHVTPLQNGTCIDIVPVGVNKAQGLYRVMEHYGGTYDDVIAVGDNYNDADMLREFRSYAMAHSDEPIRCMANDIVENVTQLLQKEMEDN